MKILYLGPAGTALPDCLKKAGNQLTFFQSPLSKDQALGFDFLLSYGYRHKIPAAILDFFENRSANLHISFLPFNRGVDPNLWSFVENTPSGVSIHRISQDIDCGEIIVQKKISFDLRKETLASSYQFLQGSIQELFLENWEAIAQDRALSFPQKTGGTHHQSRDREKLSSILTEGWDTPILKLHEYGKINDLWKGRERG